MGKDKTVAWAGLYRVRPGLTRLDFAPFLLLYSVLVAGALAPQQQQDDEAGHSQGEDGIPMWVLVAWPLVLLLHLLTHLATHWSVACDAMVSYVQVKTVREATHVRVRPPPNSGSEEMVPLENEVPLEPLGKDKNVTESIVVVGKEHRLPYARFDFQKTAFCYWAATATAPDFTRLAYPIQGLVQHYLQRTGYTERSEKLFARRLWGRNIFDIPLPPFGALFKEHAVAPFFVFQVLCVLLWSLDEYWYYSLFTLVLLVVFESTVCYQRQRSLEMLRSMRRPPYFVCAYRENRWEEVCTEALLPGDIVSLGRMNANPSDEKEGRPKVRGGSLSKFKGRGGGANRRGGAAATPLPPPPPPPPEEEAAPSERLVPCDLLLLRGTCIVNEAMLTGESTPQLKEFLEVEGHAPDDLHPPPLFRLGAGVSGDADVRSHVVFGGTKILQLGGVNNKTTSTDMGGKGASGGLPTPPDKSGSMGIVLRTGFETSQGQLMRTILFATRRVTAGSAETAVFIGILLLFALVASGIVLVEGLKDESRNKFKLWLHCIMIITSVVPPELPMELSLAVTNSLAALTKALVYCTEPFRIPYAGKVTVCCFDKTGTLTSDDLVLRGVVPLVAEEKVETAKATKKNEPEEHILPPAEVQGPSMWVLAACHSLMMVEGRVAGDPMECAAVEGLGWMVANNGDFVLPNPTTAHEMAKHHTKEDLVPIRIHHRYPFNSTLRRMTVLVSRGSSGAAKQELLLLTKGAPEAVRPLLNAVPPHYAATYLHHMGRGRRVLALAYRVLKPDEDLVTVRQWTRDEVEQGLTLAGLLIVDCPLKKDTAGVIRELQASLHRTVMITGDSALTAAEVARQIGMVPHGPEKTFHLVSKGKRGMGWEPMAKLMRLAEGGDAEEEKKNEDGFVSFRLGEVQHLASQYSLCVGGDALAELVAREVGSASMKRQEEEEEDEEEEEEEADKGKSMPKKTSNSRAGSMSRETLRWLSKLCPHVVVFARVAPDQKEMLIASLNEAGDVTLMCGDGTNDVGALKQAHVGVSIINSPELEKRAEATSSKYESRLAAMGTGADGAKSRAQVQAQAGISSSAGGDDDISRLAQILAELREQEKDPSIVQLGDASIASPFTAKRTSVECVLAVVRQGRCTLVTTLQVYKILALNCLVSAYMLSSLYLFGVKQGDLQMTALGLAVAALFFFVSRAEPLERLSAERPPARIFCAQVCVSIALQFMVHLGCLMDTLERAEPLVLQTSKDPSIAPDGPFRPNLVNTAIFLLSAVTQVNTFTANYRGHPFMQSLGENKALGYFTLGLYAVLFVLAVEVVPFFNHWLQLVPLPTAFRRHLLLLLVLDTVAVVAIERACLRWLPT